MAATGGDNARHGATRGFPERPVFVPDVVQDRVCECGSKGVIAGVHEASLSVAAVGNFLGL